jgi:hypothetical protein
MNLEKRDAYGLRQGPNLLGRTYSETARRAIAVQTVTKASGTPAPALNLLVETLRAVSSSSEDELVESLDQVIRAATVFRNLVTGTVHTYDDGAGSVWEHPGVIYHCELPECKELATALWESFRKSLGNGDSHLYTDQRRGVWHHLGRRESCPTKECGS